MPIPLKTGETLRGRYRVRRIIGQGGMGCIYLADDLRLEGRQCALKEVEHDKTLPAKMVQEARDQSYAKLPFSPVWIIQTCPKYLIFSPTDPATTWLWISFPAKTCVR